MNLNEFLEEMSDILEVDSLSLDDDLTAFEEWDSLSMMSTMVLFSKNFGINIKIKDIQNVKLVKDLVKLSDGQITE